MREPLTSVAIEREVATDQPVRGRTHRKRSIGGLGAMLFLCICVIYFLTPFFWLLVTATKSPRDLQTSFGLWFGPHFSLIENLQRIFTV